jgi:hypothetical protein
MDWGSLDFWGFSLFFGLGGIVCTKQRGTIRGKWGAGRKKPDLLQVLKVFAVFVRGGSVLRGILNELIHLNRGLNGQFCVVFERIMGKGRS